VSHDHGPHEHGPHEHGHHDHGADTPAGLRSTAASATLHCLTGCAIGEILGLVLSTAWGLATVPSIALAVGLAFLFGYALSTLPVLRAGATVGTALSVVLAADTLSIATMEVVDNLVVVAVPGAMDAGLANPTFWLSMMLALSVAYVAAYPVNRALLARGKGHALTHGYLHGEGQATGWRRRLPVLSSATLAVGIGAFLLGGLVVSVDAEVEDPAGDGTSRH
jgi:hypothetical protein